MLLPILLSFIIQQSNIKNPLLIPQLPLYHLQPIQQSFINSPLHPCIPNPLLVQHSLQPQRTITISIRYKPPNNISKYTTHVKIGRFLQILPGPEQAHPHDRGAPPEAPWQILLQIITLEVVGRQVQGDKEEVPEEDRHHAGIERAEDQTSDPEAHRDRRALDRNRLRNPQIHARIVQQ